MPDPDTEARAVRAAGRPITVADGTEVVVRVDLDNLWEIEERYGSIGALQAELEKLDAAAKDLSGPVFIPICTALAALMPSTRLDLRDPRTLARRLDPARLSDYLHAAITSLGEAVSADEAPADGRPNPPTTQVNGSPGGSSTTPAPSSSAAPTTVSGG